MSAAPEIEAGDFDAVVAEAALVDAAAAETAAAATGAAATKAGVQACLNCGAPRTGRFCASCGQQAAPIAPTLGYFVHELTHEVLNVDGKIFRSLRLLLTRPGFLTREIFAGRRASYVSPLRLYLVASVLAFTLTAFVGGFEGANVTYTPDEGETISPEQLERVAEAQRTLTRALNVWLPRAMFVLVPWFAALVMLFRRHGGHTYPQHLYFALHVHAVFFFANAFDSASEALAPPPWVATVLESLTMLYFVGYFVLAFRRVYETTIWGTLWRTVFIGLLYILTLFATIAAIITPIVMTLMPVAAS